MEEWTGLRTAAVIVVWAAVAGGALMAVIWFASGGSRAIGPEDAESGLPVRRSARRMSSFSSAQVGIHGLLGVLTASLLTYAAVRDDDRATGYIAVLVALAVTAVPGTLMFVKWRTGRRPAVARAGAVAADERVEDRLRGPIVYLHGLAVIATASLVVILLAVD